MSRLRIAGAVATLLAVTAFVAVGVVGGAQSSETWSGRACITVPELMHAFGNAVAGEDIHHVFELANPGSAPLTIESVRANCGCTTTDDWEREVPAGGTWSLPVTLKTERLHGDVRKTVVVEVAEPHAQRIEFALAGRVQPHFEITPSRNLIFAWTEKAQPTQRKITITNLLAEPVTITKTAVDNAAFQIKLNELEAGKRYEIVAKLTAGLGDKERQSGRVTLTTTSPHQPEITLPIAAFRMPTPRPSPLAGGTTGGAIAAKSKSHRADSIPTFPQSLSAREGSDRGSRCDPPMDPLTYAQDVEYDLLGDHHWFVPVMGALARDPQRPANDPLNWITGTLGQYYGNFIWDDGYFYQARYQLPYGLTLGPPPYAGPIPPATVRLVKFAGSNCDCANRDPNTPFPPTFSEAKTAADAYCAACCGDGYTMVDFEMNQWNLTCYNFGGDSYKVATWGGTRCGKVQGQTIIECDPHTKLTTVREHLWQNPLEECPECDLDGDGAISLVDVILARETGFVPRHRGVGLTYALLLSTGELWIPGSGATIDQTLDPSPFVGPDVQIIPVTYFDMTELAPGIPVDCTDPAEFQAGFLNGIVSGGGINNSLADSWCSLFGQPGATECSEYGMAYQIGHCRVSPDGTHSIRVTLGFCMRCH